MVLENPDLNPNLFVEEKVVQQFKSKYMFLGCIDFIMQVKKGVFHEHSNQLWNISGVQSWNKINEGLIKMYKKEVIFYLIIVKFVIEFVSINILGTWKISNYSTCTIWENISIQTVC